MRESMEAMRKSLEDLTDLFTSRSSTSERKEPKR